VTDTSVRGALPDFAPIPPGALPPAPGGGTAARTGGFLLAVAPTTVEQYWHYLLDRELHTAPAPSLHGFPTRPGTGLRTTASGAVEFDRESAALPVVGVTWHGARAYCAWLGEQTGTPCRLPSAAEWQYAAAGPRRLRWALGDEFDRALYAPAATGPRAVDGSPANDFGLRGLTGNVFEWCEDPLTADGGEVLPGSRVIKGGAYTVRNPESFENSTVFTADELSTVPYIGFRALAEA
jgi:formylglycine-generating enzyme required for sulfatase activity